MNSPLFAVEAKFSEKTGITNISLGATPFNDGVNAQQMYVTKEDDPSRDQVDARLHGIIRQLMDDDCVVRIELTDQESDRYPTLAIELRADKGFGDLMRILDPGSTLGNFCDEISERMSQIVAYNDAKRQTNWLIVEAINSLLE